MSKETPSTVLIIDDDKHIREYFIDYLTEIGYITYEALNAKQGIEIYS
jgi:Response regulator containing CheY-like receiver, AAA-type ATPase, and DNA-binding domains